MPAWTVYTWHYVAPGETVGAYIHGYSESEATIYSATVSPLAGDAYAPLGRINLTQGIVARHVDGRVAREAWVQNLASFNPCAVRLDVISESL